MQNIPAQDKSPVCKKCSTPLGGRARRGGFMNKAITVIRHSDPGNSGYVPGSASERIALVWPLTCEAVSLGKKYDVEQRLQRHIVRIVKQKG